MKVNITPPLSVIYGKAAAIIPWANVHRDVNHGMAASERTIGLFPAQTSRSHPQNRCRKADVQRCRALIVANARGIRDHA
jgi:hypothetical protein